MLFEKLHYPFNRYRQMLMNLNVVENVGFVLPYEPSALDPGIRKDHFLFLFLSKKQHPANRRNKVPLVFGDKAQGFQVLFHQFPVPFKASRCSVKIQVIHRHFRKSLFIKGLPFSPPPELCNKLPVRLPIGGTQPDINPLRWPFFFQPVGPGAAGVDLHPEQSLILKSDQLHIGNQARLDTISDLAAQTFFLIQGIFNAQNLP